MLGVSAPGADRSANGLAEARMPSQWGRAAAEPLQQAVVLDGHHAPPPMVGRQYQSRGDEWTGGWASPTADLAAHGRAARAKMTLATAEKSFRP